MTQEITSLLGQDAEFEGTLRFEGVVRIDGSFRGRIESSGTLVVGRTGRVSAEVQVGACVLEGTFEGTLQAGQSVEIHAPARVKGKIVTPELQVDRGVVLDGECVMSSSSQVLDGPVSAPGEEEGE